MSSEHLEAKSADALVMSKALKRAAGLWGLTNKQLGHIIGLSEASISHLALLQSPLKKGHKSWQLALMFLRIFRGLDAYMGGHIENERRWLTSPNAALQGVPLELMGEVEGLVNVLNYIDFVQGR